MRSHSIQILTIWSEKGSRIKYQLFLTKASNLINLQKGHFDIGQL